MPRPKVLVLATPYLFASLIGRLLAERGHDVAAPDLDAGEQPPAGRFDGVVTTSSAIGVDAAVTIALPQSFEEPVVVTVEDLRVAVSVDLEHPVEDVIVLLERALRDTHVTPTA